MTPLVGALWQTGVHQEVSPNRGNNRANEPEPTPIDVSSWEKGIAKIIAAVRRAEGPGPTRGLGLQFQSAVHKKISDS